ncbi:MAG: hypothetical protein ACTHLZ_19135, partial [Tepidisphaeraceae bacterium]
LTNDDVLKVNQDARCAKAKRVRQSKQIEVWVKPLENGDQVVGLFNRSNAAADVDLAASDVGLSGMHQVRDLWAHQDLKPSSDTLTLPVPAHGSVLLRIK